MSPKPFVLQASARPVKRRGGAAAAVCWLLIVTWLPSVPLYLLGASSMAAGTLGACVISTLRMGAYRFNSTFALARQCRLLLLPCVAVAVHFGVAALIQPVDLGRFAASWLLLVIFLVGASAFVRMIFGVGPRGLHRALSVVLVALVLCAAVGLAGIAPSGPIPYDKPVFPFTEPSHFALSFAPFLMYVAISSSGWKRGLVLLIGIGLALAMENMTLLVVGILVTLICNLRSAILLVPLAVVVLTPFIDFYYFLSRVDFSSDNDNLSTLVFIQGWQLMEESLQNSSFWGLGFQQLGVKGTEVPIADVIYTLMSTYVNLNDGSFTLSKLVSEFGIFGIVLALGHFFGAWKSAVRLRRHALGATHIPVATRFAYAVVVGYSVELLIRGAGYFTASSLMYAASLLYLFQTRHFTLYKSNGRFAAVRRSLGRRFELTSSRTG